MQHQTVPEARPGFPHFAPGEHRALLADVHRWMRSKGCSNTSRGWINERYLADAAVAVTPVTLAGKFEVSWRQGNGGWERPVSYPAIDAGQAVDLLVALNILPVTFSSAYEAGADSTREVVEAARAWVSAWDREHAERALNDAIVAYDIDAAAVTR